MAAFWQYNIASRTRGAPKHLGDPSLRKERPIEKNEFTELLSFWFAKSTAQNNIHGKGNLAFCYDEGIGVEKDLAKAAALYKEIEGEQIVSSNGACGAPSTKYQKRCLSYAAARDS